MDFNKPGVQVFLGSVVRPGTGYFPWKDGEPQSTQDKIIRATEALICSLLAVGADHILFSADYPYAPLDRMTQFVETAPISEFDREKICHLNTERLLKLS